jgi:hypothetical protein
MKSLTGPGCSLCLLALFSSVFPQYTKSDILEIFKKEIRINEDFKRSATGPDSKSISGASYDTLYQEDAFITALDSAEILICKNRDHALLHQFYDVLISDTNSADEQPTYILGHIFLCQSDLVISEYNKLGSQKKAIILRYIKKAFKYATSEQGSLISNYDELRAKLIKMKTP